MKNIKKYVIKAIINDVKHELIPIMEHYNSGNLAVVLYEYKTGEEYAVITKNIPMANSPEDNVAFIDTNNYSWIEKLLIKNSIAKPTGHITYSGFCKYPEYKFNLDKLFA